MTFIYGLTRNARAIVRIRAEAKLLDEGEPDALAQAGPEKLIEALASDDLRSRFYAARRLGSHRGSEAVRALMARAGDADEHWLVRRHAVIALGQLEAQGAVDLLGRLLEDRKADLACFATQALARISKSVTPGGLDDPDDGLSLEPAP
jgi:HEAT repeat protein